MAGKLEITYSVVANHHGEMKMQHRNLLMDYLKEQGVKNIASFSDGALLNPVKFQLAAIETRGAILFADLPGYSKLSQELSPVECAYMVSHFFSWFEGEAGKNLVES